MLKNVKISNFRAFDKEVDIRIRPVTVLIGQNNAGKSTLIKFLLMLQQTIEAGEDAFLVTEGRHVSLGSFKDLKNTSSRSKRLKFELKVETKNIPSDQVGEIRKKLLEANRSEQVSELKIALEKTAKPSKNLSPVTFKISSSISYGKEMAGWHKVTAGNIFSVESDDLKRTGFLLFPRDSDTMHDLLEAFLRDLYLQNLRSEIRSLRHLSPVREEYQRKTAVKTLPSDDVGHMGEFAILHLQRLFEHGKKAEFIRKHIENVVDIVDLKFIPSFMAYECRAKNRLTGSEAYLGDFGFGVSQCIPVFVQGVLLKPGQLLIVEEPEAQLHPTAQLEMGSFFGELWKNWGVPCLIETHSENIILRLRRLISKGELDAGDVSIAYFHIEDNMVRVRNLDINSDGSLYEGLPMSFFGGDVLEALGMEAGV
ncbi:MAG: AAA family ATPase [Desulfobacteraceae bacterium]|nr:AAA family ATPase [Desulfobacteraceae bacterium]